MVGGAARHLKSAAALEAAVKSQRRAAASVHFDPLVYEVSGGHEQNCATDPQRQPRNGVRLRLFVSTTPVGSGPTRKSLHRC